MHYNYRLVLRILIVFLSVTFCSLPLQASFPDTKNHKYEDSIDFLEDENIVEGHPDGRFGVDETLNRAEMMKILLEYKYGGDIEEEANCFEDVHAEWFAKYICKAKEEGIIEGYNENLFKPAQDVNMAEGLKMAFETFDLELPDNETNVWYTPYVELAHDSSIFSKHSYLPDRPMKRGEMAFLMHQLILNEEGTKLLTDSAQYWSKGCGKTPPKTVPNSSKVDGVERSYITVLPDDYEKDEPKKLIFAFHGRTNSNAEVRKYYKMEQAAGNEAIIVYPSGLPTNSSPRHWQDTGDKASEIRDYALFDQLLEEFSENYCVDLDEVYVVGHSLGAWFTNSLACFRGEAIRGVGTIGGGTSLGECTGPVAAMIWHNPEDQQVPFKDGEQARDQYLEQNQCSSKSLSVEPKMGNCVEYQGCYEDSPTLWCPHSVNNDGRGYYPHTWPNGAGEEIWEFFKELK